MHSILPLSDRISAFIQLGNLLATFDGEEKELLFQRAQNQNAWFTFSSLEKAVKGIQLLLDAKALEKWVGEYSFPKDGLPLSIGLLLAGNIPAVGFHDILSVLIAGHNACIKLSSQDSAVLLWLLSELKKIEPRFAERIQIEELLKNKDAYIATGSDNSARYFNYYFGKYPHLIRSNRTSVAVLTGNESAADLQGLGHDSFDYFGLGCRNVSKLFVKNKSQLSEFFEAIQSFEWVANHHKYFNNYEYNKSIYLVNGTTHLDNGFLLVRESKDLVSPIGVLYYEVYKNEEALHTRLSEEKDKIQCVVGGKDVDYAGIIPFGATQCPSPWDYADGLDTLQFLTRLNR